jgi:hypothetical protein
MPIIHAPLPSLEEEEEEEEVGDDLRSGTSI